MVAQSSIDYDRQGGLDISDMSKAGYRHEQRQFAIDIKLVYLK